MTDKEKLINAFNQGYLLHYNKPDLAKKLMRNLNEKEDVYSKALISGINESQKEDVKLKSKNYERFTPTISKSKENTKDKDIDKG